MMREGERSIHARMIRIPRANPIRRYGAIPGALQGLNEIAIEKSPRRISRKQEHRLPLPFVDVRHPPPVHDKRALLPRKHLAQTIRLHFLRQMFSWEQRSLVVNGR